MMQRRLLISALTTLLLSGGVATAADTATNVIYVESDGMARSIGQEKIANCVRLLQHEMGIDGKTLPTIVVIHVSRREGDRAGLKKVAAKLRINSDRELADKPYYELWLAGDTTTYDYVYSLHYLLQQHFALRETEAEQKSTIARVVRWMDATVSAKK